MIAEKAWAKIHGSYEAIETGCPEDALSYLTGGFPSSSKFRYHDKTHVEEVTNGSLWRRLLSDHRSNTADFGCFISASGVDPATSTLRRGAHVSISPSHWEDRKVSHFLRYFSLFFC